MRDALLKNQKEDGHWDIPPKSAEKFDGLANKVYGTTLSCLMLEVYYRYLPIYQLIDKPTPAAAPTAPGTAAKG